jgi:predicted O-linked N-acetylglucosamine transferase (SPINDLY family)
MQNQSFQRAVEQARQLHRAGHLAQARALYERLLSANPKWGDGYAELAEVLFADDQAAAAASALNYAIANGASNPAFCHNNLGVIFDRLRLFDQAAQAFGNAIRIDPRYAIAHRNLGDALRQLDRWDAAEHSYRAALNLSPGMVDAHIGIGITLYFRNRLPEAVAQFQTALQLDPASTNACMNLVLCYVRLGDRQATEDALRKAIALSPNEPDLHSGLLMMQNYTHGMDPQFILNAAREFDRLHIQPLAGSIEPFAIDSDPARKLRIGFISPDFREHPVAYFLRPLLRQIDSTQFFISCYAEVARPDDITAEFTRLTDRWHSTVGLSHDQVARQIRADRIDILIDLAGHTVDNRLPVLGRRPAPVQMAWLGYPSTTGVSTIDYRITDALADPPGVDRFYTEKLLRLPDAFFVYHPPAADVTIPPLPMRRNGHITFGSLNNIAKITPEVGQLWARILTEIPEAKLLIAGVDASAELRVRELIPDVEHARIQTFAFDQYNRLYDLVDVALDPFPWAGHTTTCHAVWRGIPVITLAGPTALSRAGVSVMTNLRLDRHWVGASTEDYIALAKYWAGHIDELEQLRSGLNQRLRESVLMDAPLFARNFEAILRRTWQQT